jgi:DNA-binding transcriptional MerR regulator
MPSARKAQQKIASSPARPEPRRSKPMTIGAVCKSLSREFPEISISKIRYLENQRLVEPRRTPGGYRLYSADDLARLRTILRLQRDEFLPLRVIRQELAIGRGDGGTETLVPAGTPRAKARRMPPVVATTVGPVRTLDELLEATGADLELVRELEAFGIISGTVAGVGPGYDDNQCEVVRAAVELARYGVGARNLRVFKTSADRESALLQQLLAPSLRSRSAERRLEATEALEDLAAVTTHLKHLLLIGDLRAMLV